MDMAHHEHDIGDAAFSRCDIRGEQAPRGDDLLHDLRGAQIGPAHRTASRFSLLGGVAPWQCERNDGRPKHRSGKQGEDGIRATFASKRSAEHGTRGRDTCNIVMLSIRS